MLEQLIQTGRFTSTGNTTVLAFRSDVDFIEIINLNTVGSNANPGVGSRFLWQRGMAVNDALVTYNTNAALTIQQALAVGLGVGGFTLVNDTTDPILGADSPVSNVSNVVQPIVDSNDTQDLVAGDTVRMSFNAANAMRNMAGIDFTVDTITLDTDFRIATPLNNGPGAYGVASGAWRKVNRDPIFYPRVRNIVNLTIANPCVVSLSVTHEFIISKRCSLPV